MNLSTGTRVALVAEELSDRPDEGVLRTLERLTRFLDERVELDVYYCRGSAPHGISAHKLPFTRAGITPALWNALRDGDFQLILYAPSASLTLNALWRARLIRMASRCPVITLGFQRRSLQGLAGGLAAGLAPGVVAVTSDATAGELAASGFQVLTLPMGVDLDRFSPLDGAERAAARESLGWNDGDFVVLHVGHLRAGRGLDALGELGTRAGHRVVVVASVSESGEEHLADGLRAQGIEIHHEFIPDIERFYQAADAYVFPVRASSSAIDFPLSVLEALACGLPVLSTPYGALAEHFTGEGGLRFLDDGESLAPALDDLMGRDARPRELVADMGWEEVLQEWVEQFEGALR